VPVCGLWSVVCSGLVQVLTLLLIVLVGNIDAIDAPNATDAKPLHPKALVPGELRLRTERLPTVSHSTIGSVAGCGRSWLPSHSARPPASQPLDRSHSQPICDVISISHHVPIHMALCARAALVLASYYGYAEAVKTILERTGSTGDDFDSGRTVGSSVSAPLCTSALLLGCLAAAVSDRVCVQ
jgi:hypothetical protein